MPDIVKINQKKKSTNHKKVPSFVRHQMIRFHVEVTREYPLSQMDVSVGKKG